MSEDEAAKVIPDVAWWLRQCARRWDLDGFRSGMSMHDAQRFREAADEIEDLRAVVDLAVDFFNDETTEAYITGIRTKITPGQGRAVRRALDAHSGRDEEYPDAEGLAVLREQGNGRDGER